MSDSGVCLLSSDHGAVLHTARRAGGEYAGANGCSMLISCCTADHLDRRGWSVVLRGLRVVVRLDRQESHQRQAGSGTRIITSRSRVENMQNIHVVKRFIVPVHTASTSIHSHVDSFPVLCQRVRWIGTLPSTPNFILRMQLSWRQPTTSTCTPCHSANCECVGDAKLLTGGKSIFCVTSGSVSRTLRQVVWCTMCAIGARCRNSFGLRTSLSMLRYVFRLQL